MPTSFAPSTVAELTSLLERRRQSSADLTASLHVDAVSALVDRDLSDLLDDDDPDGGSNNGDRAQALRLPQDAVRTAAAGDAALAAGTYGVCDGCGERIPLARLRAVPETHACVDCLVTGGLLALAR